MMVVRVGQCSTESNAKKRSTKYEVLQAPSVFLRLLPWKAQRPPVVVLDEATIAAKPGRGTKMGRRYFSEVRTSLKYLAASTSDTFRTVELLPAKAPCEASPSTYRATCYSFEVGGSGMCRLESGDFSRKL
jgi:hypothetical protein